MIYKSNRHVVYSCKYQVVLCPKYRRKDLVNDVDKRLNEIIDQIAKELGCEILELEVIPALACGASVPDHVHIHCDVDSQLGVHNL